MTHIDNRKGDRRMNESDSIKTEEVKPMKPLFRPTGSMCVKCQHVDRDCSYLDFSTMQVIAEDSRDRDSGIITQVVKCSEYVKDKQGKYVSKNN